MRFPLLLLLMLHDSGVLWVAAWGGDGSGQVYYTW